MKTLTRLILFAATLGGIGCTSPTLTSTPAGAKVVREIYRKGDRPEKVLRVEPVVGATPTKMAYRWASLGPGESLRLRFEKDGYFPEIKELRDSQGDKLIHADLRTAPYSELWTPTIVFQDDGRFHYDFTKTRAFIATTEKEGVVADKVLDSGDGDVSYFGSLFAAPDGNLLYSRHEIELSADGIPTCSVVNLFRKGIDDNSPSSRITDGFINLDATCSPDMKWIYLASNRLGNQFDIFRVPVTPPLNFTLVTQGEENEVEPCFEPKEPGLLAYTSYPRNSSQPRLWTIGSNLQNFPTELREGHSPAIAPDGRTVAFIGPNGHLWTMTTSGENRTQISFGATSSEGEPAWSPDGKWLLFASNQGVDEFGYQNNNVWIYSMELQKTTQLTVNGSDDRSPVFSRDGKYVLFVSNRGLKWGIWRIAFNPASVFGSPLPPAPRT